MTTAEQLLDLPDDGLRHELIRGKLRTISPAGFEHGRLSAHIGSLLFAFVHERGLGVVLGAETGFTIERGPDTVRAPDAAFVAADRVPPAEQRAGFAELAPDLVVEVVSPSDRAAEVADKVLQWLEAGSRLVWVIYPERRVVAVHHPGGEAHLLGPDEELDGGAVLPGFRVRVADLFA